MFIGISKSDETVSIVKSGFMSAPHCPLSGAFEAAAYTGAAGDFHGQIREALFWIEYDRAAARVAYDPSTPALAWIVTSHGRVTA